MDYQHIFSSGTTNLYKISLSGDRRPLGLLFNFSNEMTEQNLEVRRIFMNAIRGEAHQDIVGFRPSCSHIQTTGGCGNRRGDLEECRCRWVDRTVRPSVRRDYEDRVINGILETIENSQDQTNFSFKLAIFASGRLLAEEILLFRLFHELESRNYSGKIRLFLIDQCYRRVITVSTHSDVLIQSLGNERYVRQFIEEIHQHKPIAVRVEGIFFFDAEHYVRLAEKDDKFRHHYLIGAEIEGTQACVENIASAAESSEGPGPLMLMKIPETGVNSLLSAPQGVP